MFEFTVDGMSCNHCVQAITRAVKEQDPAASVTIDLPSKSVTIESTLALDHLRQVVEAEGYPVTTAQQR